MTIINFILIIIFKRSGLKGVLVLAPLLGITWIIGIFAFSEQTTIFLWLFTILNSLQVSIKFIHVLIFFIIGINHLVHACFKK